MRSLRIGLCAEGNSDRDFFEPLFRRLLAGLVTTETALSVVPVGLDRRSPSAVSGDICDAWSQGGIDLVCIHRDADSAARQHRALIFVRTACDGAAEGCGVPAGRCVPAVPMRATEAWALADAAALAGVLRRSRLDAATAAACRQPETIHDPKGVLKTAVGRARTPMAAIAEAMPLDSLRRLESFRAFEAAFLPAAEAALRGPFPTPPPAASG